MRVALGAHAGEVGDDAARGGARPGALGARDDGSEALRRGGEGILVILRDGAGAHEEVAVDGGTHEDALARGRGHLEHRAREVRLEAVVIQVILAANWGYMELAGGELVMELIGVDARRVYHGAGADDLAVHEGDGEALPLTGEVGDARVKRDAHAVLDGVLERGEGNLIRVADGARRDAQRAGDLGRQGRLELTCLVSGDDREPLDAAGAAALEKTREGDLVLVAKADHQRLVVDVGKS